jgi:hypothetical protein
MIRYLLRSKLIALRARPGKPLPTQGTSTHEGRVNGRVYRMNAPLEKHGSGPRSANARRPVGPNGGIADPRRGEGSLLYAWQGPDEVVQLGKTSNELLHGVRIDSKIHDEPSDCHVVRVLDRLLRCAALKHRPA